MATYGSAEWAQQQYGNKYYKPPVKPTQKPQTYNAPVQQPSYYSAYQEYMKQQQAAQQAAQSRAQQQAMEQQSLWLKLTQKPAKETTAGAGNALSKWWQQQQAKQNNGNLVGRNGSGMWSNFSGINQWTGQPYQNYGNLPYEAQYQYGLPTTKQDYINSMEQNRQSLFPLVMDQMQVKKPGLTEDQLEILREQRRGYQVGMPGIDGFVQPQVLPGTTPTGNTAGWTFPELMYPSYGGGGGYSYPRYSTSQDASKWYNTMVQWNIGNKQ